MGLFNSIFGSYLLGRQPDTDKHDAYIAQLNATIEKQKRDLKIEEEFRENLKKQQEKLRMRTIEGEFEVIEESKQLKGGGSNA